MASLSYLFAASHRLHTSLQNKETMVPLSIERPAEPAILSPVASC